MTYTSLYASQVLLIFYHLQLLQSGRGEHRTYLNKSNLIWQILKRTPMLLERIEKAQQLLVQSRHQENSSVKLCVREGK